MSRIPLSANERDIYQFFAKAGVGKIRDVRLIRDQRSGKSKGYVGEAVREYSQVTLTRKHIFLF